MRIWRAILICGLLSMSSPVIAQEAPVETSTSSIEEAKEAERLRKLTEELEKLSGDSGLGDNDTERERVASAGQSLFASMVKMVLTLGAVCLLAYLLLGKLLPKLMKIEPPVAQRRIMQVIDRLPIDQRRSLMVIRIGEQYFLIGASEGGIHLISKLEADQIGAVLTKEDSPPPSLGKLASLLSRKRE